MHVFMSKYSMDFISNITNSQLIDYPWRHQVINNFFTKEDFIEIEAACQRLMDHYKDTAITGHDCLTIAQVYDIIGDNAFNIILDSNRQMLEHMEEIVRNFPKHRTFSKYFSIPTFHILPSNYGPQKIHDEAYDKVSSLVVYLYPESSVGTAFFSDSTQESFVKELEWEQNKAMLFCGEEKTTWHDFYSKENPRVTLNYFIRELRSDEIAETDSYMYFKGVDGPKTIIPKSLPDRIIKSLTSGALTK
jgi:hypothetical protein